MGGGGGKKQSRFCLCSDSHPNGPNFQIGKVDESSYSVFHYGGRFILFRERASTMRSSGHMETFTMRLECVVGHAGLIKEFAGTIQVVGQAS